MAFFHTIKNPIYGISSIPAIARPEGFCEDQLNWFNDPKRGMTRKNSGRLIGTLATLDDIVRTIRSDTFREELEYLTYSLVETVRGNLALLEWVGDGITNTIVYEGLPTGWLLEHKYKLFYIDKKVYIVNTSVDVQTSVSVTDRNSFGTSNLTIPQAIGYSEKVSARVLWRTNAGVDIVLLDWVSYTSVGYDGNNQVVADQSRARDKVTNELVALLRVQYTSPFGQGAQTFQVFSIAGSIDVLMATADLAHAALLDGNLVVEVESSNMETYVATNDAIIAFNSVIGSTVGLPKYATINGVKRVQADPRDEKGAFYLRPSPINNAANTGIMYEVSWVETHAPSQYRQFVATTLPLVYDKAAGTTTHVAFKARPAGDDLSNKEPHFVGHRIRALCGAQERLGILSEDKVWWSRTDDTLQMWRTSAVQVLATDAFGIGNAGATNVFEHVVTHNKSLLFVSAQQQCKIDGNTPLTNGSTTMPIVTSSTVDTKVEPLSIGSRVYLPTRVADSTGLLEYFTSSISGVDEVEPVTDHVKGVMRGNILSLSGNDNSNVLVVRTTGTPADELLVANINTNDPELRVHAWSRWSYKGMVIVSAIVTEELVRVYGYYEKEGVKYWAQIDTDIYYNPYTIKNRVCLDLAMDVLAASRETTLNLPAGYPEGVLVATPIDGNAPLISEKVERVGDTITFRSTAGVTYVIGLRYESTLVLSKLYKYDQNGLPILSDRLRVLHLIVHMDEMYRLARRVVSKHFDIPDEWMVTESNSNMEYLYKLEAFTGEYRYGVSMNSADGNIALFTDYELAGTVTGIAYRGNMLNVG